jgi:integrase
MRLYYISKPIKGTNSVYVILKYKFQSNQVDLSPSVKCLEKDFGDGKGDNPIKRTDPESLTKNEVLRLYKEDVNRVIFQLSTDGIEPIVERVRDEFKKINEKKKFEIKSQITLDRYPVLYVLNKFSDSYTEKGNPYSRSVKFRVKVLNDFIVHNYKNTLEFYHINYDFYQKLQDYLVQKEYSNTTTSKIIGQFRQFLVWSKKNKFVSEIDTDFKTKLGVSYKQVITLSEEQIKELQDYREFDYDYNKKSGTPLYVKHYKSWNNENYLIKEELRKTMRDDDGNVIRDSKGFPVGDLPTGKYRTYTTYELTKDLFLFSISTGLRWSDVVKLRVNDFDFDKKSFNLIQKKTSMMVHITENKLSKKIFTKYSTGKSLFQYLFPLPCKENDKTRQNYNTKLNHHLKKVGEILKFKNNVEVISMKGKEVIKSKVPLFNVLSFHMGRKTHSTIGIQRGVDPFTMTKQMGHSTLSQTSVYVGKDTERLSELMDFIEPIKEEKDKSQDPTKELTMDGLKNKLEDLKKLFESGMISKERYDEREGKLLDDYGI